MLGSLVAAAVCVKLYGIDESFVKFGVRTTVMSLDRLELGILWWCPGFGQREDRRDGSHQLLADIELFWRGVACFC